MFLNKWEVIGIWAYGLFEKSLILIGIGIVSLLLGVIASLVFKL